MENIEVLKLVKRKHNNSYRAVLDLSLVDDIKNYSGWGKSDFLYRLFMNLIKSEDLYLLKPPSNEKKVKYLFSSAEVTADKIFIEEKPKFKLEMPIEEFFEFYDEYNRLIREKAHEIVLRRKGGQITAEGTWYKDDSPFNQRPEISIFKLSKNPKGFCFMPMYVGECLDLIIDEDEYGGDVESLYQIMTFFYPGRNIGIKYARTREFAIAYWNYIKDNSAELVDKDVFAMHDGYNLEFRQNNKILAQGYDWSNDEYFDLFEMNLDTFYEIYIKYLELKEQNPMPDEILFIKENGKINIEGIWYKDKENKKEQNYIKR